MRSISIDAERFFAAVEECCPSAREDVERLVKRRAYSAHAEEVAQVMLSSGCPREAVLRFLRELKIEDETIATIMRMVALEQPKIDFSRLKTPERRELKKSRLRLEIEGDS